MKRILPLCAFLCISLYAPAQTITWYYTTDGVNGSGWPKLDVIIPDGIRIDSIYGGFQRPTLLEDSEDYGCGFELGTTYTGTGAISPWNYADTATSLYNHWIDLISFNFVGEGVLRVAIPGGSDPAIWDSLGVGTTSTLGVDESEQALVFVYPNPASDVLRVQTTMTCAYTVTDLTGRVHLTGNLNGSVTINLSDFATGIYVLQIGENRRIKFIVE